MRDVPLAALGRRLTLGLLGLIALTGASGDDPRSYAVSLLDNLPSPSSPGSDALSVNNHGVIVGVSNVENAFAHGVHWSAWGEISDLTPDLRNDYTAAFDVNDDGQVVGAIAARAVLWTGKQVTYLGTLGGATSTAVGINSAGDIVGHATTSSGDSHAFLWRGGSMTDLGTLGGVRSNAYAINANSQVVGSALTANGELRATLWERGVARNLGTLPGDSYSVARDLNDAGQVVGYSVSPHGKSRAFLWHNGTMKELKGLGGPQSAAYGINQRGEIVGYATTADDVRHAVVWRDGVPRDLHAALGQDKSTAHSINDVGEIVGTAGQQMAFRLNPLIRGVDVALRIAPESRAAIQGEHLSYVLYVSNQGTQRANGVVLTHSLPTGVTLVSVRPSQGECARGPTISCALGDLASGKNARVDVVVIPQNTGALLNSASVSANDIDADSANNAAVITLPVDSPPARADLSVDLSATPARPQANAQVSFLISVHNHGPGTATNIRLHNSLPANMHKVSASTTRGRCSGQGVVRCELGDLNAGGRLTVTVVARARSAGTYTNAAHIESDALDPKTQNNSSELSLDIK